MCYVDTQTGIYVRSTGVWFFSGRDFHPLSYSTRVEGTQSFIVSSWKDIIRHRDIIQSCRGRARLSSQAAGEARQPSEVQLAEGPPLLFPAVLSTFKAPISDWKLSRLFQSCANCVAAPANAWRARDNSNCGIWKARLISWVGNDIYRILIHLIRREQAGDLHLLSPSSYIRPNLTFRAHEQSGHNLPSHPHPVTRW